MRKGTVGTMQVDYEERINFDRMRTERLAKIHREMEKTDLGALLLFDPGNKRYATSTAVASPEVDQMGRYAIVPPGRRALHLRLRVRGGGREALLPLDRGTGLSRPHDHDGGSSEGFQSRLQLPPGPPDGPERERGRGGTGWDRYPRRPALPGPPGGGIQDRRRAGRHARGPFDQNPGRNHDHEAGGGGRRCGLRPDGLRPSAGGERERSPGRGEPYPAHPGGAVGDQCPDHQRPSDPPPSPISAPTGSCSREISSMPTS